MVLVEVALTSTLNTLAVRTMREREKGLFFLPPLFPLSLEFETGTDWKEREKNVE